MQNGRHTTGNETRKKRRDRASTYTRVHRRHHLEGLFYTSVSVPVRHHKCEHIWTVRIRKRTLAAGTRTMKNEGLKVLLWWVAVQGNGSLVRRKRPL